MSSVGHLDSPEGGSVPDRDGELFEVGLRQGVWHVFRDGAFFGHYRGRGAAVAAAQEAARRPLSRARMAEVIVHDDDL